MKMRSISRFFMGMLAVCTIAACSDDLGNGSDVNPDASKDAVYMNVTVQLPVAGGGARSQTKPEGGSTDGIEIGLDRENKVNSVLLVLANKENKFIGSTEASVTPSTTTTTITSTHAISKSTISTYYGKDGKLSDDERKINVFVFCNPTTALRKIFEVVSVNDITWYDQICTISETSSSCDNSGIWGGEQHENGFLMSSFAIPEKKIPMDFQNWDKYTTKEKPFQLSGNNTGLTGGMQTEINNSGNIKVERSVARFDFKDGSGNTEHPNTYNVVFEQKETNPKCLVQIELTRMALVNMSKNFYYLRRVSNDGLGKSNDNNEFELCGLETDKNYVVDTDATQKKDGTIISGNKYAEHFNFCLGHTPTGGKWTIDENARGQWYASKISDVLSSTSPDDNPNWDGTTKYGNYKIWRYVTENAIPAPPAIQQNGISTGIVFKGKMIATDAAAGTSLAGALNDKTTAVSSSNSILYAYGNDIYVTWKEVRAKAIELGPTSPMYGAVFGANITVTPVAEKTDVTPIYSDDPNSADAKWNLWHNTDGAAPNTSSLKEFKSAATENGFTLYERSEDPDSGKGYYCYYFYWNRHNDNGNPGVMQNMEFAVVRNNVYKLAVTEIKKLGHPRISENDPDPVDPDDPDEDGDVYLSVSVEILPWVVRINNIEF